MALYKRYSGEFYSRAGTIWRCEIWQEAASAYATVAELRFPFDNALALEWSSKSKEEPVCGSTATLSVVSESDRAYIGLYAIRAGSVRLDVYRANVLYWSGTLDTEFYEEPYSTARGYEVQLTFSDFGILDRIKYDLSGQQTFRALLETALTRSGINYTSIDESHISTLFADGSALTLAALAILSENWFDEDGDASTWMAVLDGILQPLALRMVQKGGVIYIYDLNGLYSGAVAKRITWTGDDAVLGTDVVYNNIKVTFSPYSKGQLASGELTYGDICGPEWSNLGSDAADVKYEGNVVPAGMSAPECYSYYQDYSEDHRVNGLWDYNLVSFTLFRSDDSTLCTGLASKGSANRYFKILPVLGGSEIEGVAGGFYTGGHGDLASGFPVLKGINPELHTQTVAMTTRRVYLPGLSSADGKANYLKLSLPLLFDPRYNPEESEGDANEGGNYAAVKAAAAMAFVPVSIVMYDASGTALKHWSNKSLTMFGHPGDSVANLLGAWADGDAAFGDAWLAYYDADNFPSGCGVLGWQTNRQNFGVPVQVPTRTDLWYLANPGTDGQTFKQWWIFDSFKQAPEGQFIAYPPVGGYIEVKIWNGVWCFSPLLGDSFTQDLSDSSFSSQGLYSKIRWQMYQAPALTVVKKTLTLDDSQIDDVEYNGVLNADAKEGLELDTVVGTTDDVCPTARGVLLAASTGEQLHTLQRAGVTDHPEQLLIGTLYSQFAERHTKLTGECSIDADGLHWYREDSQDGDVRLLMAGETQDVITDTTSAELVELSADNYQGQ